MYDGFVACSTRTGEEVAVCLFCACFSLRRPFLALGKHLRDDLAPAVGPRPVKFTVVYLVKYEDVFTGGAERFDLVWCIIKVQVG